MLDIKLKLLVFSFVLLLMGKIQIVESVKGNAQFVEKVTFELWWISNKTIMEVGNTIKTAAMKSLLLLSYKNRQLVFCGQCFSIFSGDKH